MYIQKCLYRYAYRYAKRCQERYFDIYVLKYIKKHIKFRRRNDEYDLLLIVIDNDTDRLMESNAKLLNMEQKGFANYLYSMNRSIYDLKRQDYTYRLKSKKTHIDNVCALYMKQTKINDRDMIQDIVSYSIDFQDVFQKSDLVAKTKIQEHWFMRLPIYIACMSLIYVLKLYEVISEITYYDYIFKIGLITVVYVMSIYMVSIRFHQSVSAETKKLSSEVYSNNKHKLYMKMTKHI